MGPWWTLALGTGCEPEASTSGDTALEHSGGGHTASSLQGHTAEPEVPFGAYGITGLRAEPLPGMASILRVSWTQAAEATVQVAFSFAGEDRASPPRTLAAGEHEELLLGVPFGTEVTWHLALDGASGAEVTPDRADATGPLPAGVPPQLLEGAAPGRFDPSMEYLLVSISEGTNYFGGRWWALLLDRQARVVWARPSESRRVTMYGKVSAAGSSFLLDQNSYWGAFDGGWNSQVVELRIDGSEVRRWDTPGLHHAFTQMPSGDLLFGSYTGGFGAYEENVIRLHPDGTPEVLMVCRDWLDSIGEFDESCGSNTLTYVPATGSVLVSWFWFDSVTEIDLATRDVVRVFGHVNGAYAFDPPSSAFWYQHGPLILEDGRLLISTHVTRENTELVAREYEIDDANRTLRQVWSVGQGQGVTGNQMGEAHRLANGNTLHNFGTNAHLREYTPAGEVVWEVDWPIESTLGRSEPVLADLYTFAPERR